MTVSKTFLEVELKGIGLTDDNDPEPGWDGEVQTQGIIITDDDARWARPEDVETLEVESMVLRFQDMDLLNPVVLWVIHQAADGTRTLVYRAAVEHPEGKEPQVAPLGERATTADFAAMLGGKEELWDSTLTTIFIDFEHRVNQESPDHGLPYIWRRVALLHYQFHPVVWPNVKSSDNFKQALKSGLIIEEGPYSLD